MAKVLPYAVMTKRKLTKKQQSRISVNQTNQLIKPARGQHQGLLLASYGKYADVLTETKETLRCNVRQNLPALVVGDQVVWQAEANDSGVICAVQPRRSELYRQGFRGVKKVIAANLQKLLIVLPTLPGFTERLLDSYLAAASVSGLEAVIVVNKIDLLDEVELAELKNRLMVYTRLGYKQLWVSGTKKLGLDELRQQLINQQSAFVGPSGAGKSTLIKDFVGDQAIKIGTVSSGSHQGRHTTTTSQLYFLSEGGVLIDSPGVRGFSLGQLSKQQVYDCFPETKAYLGQCQFRNCSHHNEPGCALLAAVDEGAVAVTRLESLQKLMEEAS